MSRHTTIQPRLPHQLEKQPLPIIQLLRRIKLLDLPRLEDNNPIRIQNSIDPVRNRNNSPLLKQPAPQRLL